MPIPPFRIPEGPRPVALCHCGTPLVSTLEVPKKEWYCIKCKQFFEWLHARAGDAPNPTPELIEAVRVATEQYDAEFAERMKGSDE